MKIDFKFPKAWKTIIETELSNIAVPTGRVSGKTKNAVDLSVLFMLQNPYTDVVIARSSYGSIEDTTYAEYKTAIEMLPPEISEQFVFYKSPLKIVRKGNAGTIYFIAAGGANLDRTKGLHTSHPVKMVICEETQEFRTKQHYDQFMASVRRNLSSDNPKVVILGNPPAIEAHWFNMFIRQCQADKDWLVVKMTWLDIIDFLNDYDIKEILKCKMTDLNYYNWLYGGEPTGGLGQVYPMFRKDLHLIDYEYRSTSKLLHDFRIIGCIIGCDGAVNNDCTCLVPRFIMSNGQSVAGKIFYHNPKENGVKGSFPLVENEIYRWFKELRRENGLDNPSNWRYSIPIIFAVDSAATELIQALRYYFGNRAEVHAIKKGTIIQMVDTVQSAIGKNVVAVYDYGGYYNYTKNQWVKCDNILAMQYRSLIWNEKQTGYDPAIPNDCTDADTYGIYFYYRQAENIVWLSDVANKKNNYFMLNK